MSSNAIRFNGIYGTAYKHGLIKKEVPIELDNPRAELFLYAEKPGKITIEYRNGTMGSHKYLAKDKFFDEVRINNIDERSDIHLTGYSKVNIDDMSGTSSLVLRDKAKANILKIKDDAELCIHDKSNVSIKYVNGGEIWCTNRLNKIEMNNKEKSVELKCHKPYNLPLPDFTNDIEIKSIDLLG